MLSRTLVTSPRSDRDAHAQDAGARLDIELVARRLHDAVVDSELHEAAHAVAGHLRFGAVGVEDAHPHRRALGADGEDQPVGADAEVAVAHRSSERAPVALGRARVDDDEVVAGAVQLREVHARSGYRAARRIGKER